MRASFLFGEIKGVTRAHVRHIRMRLHPHPCLPPLVCSRPDNTLDVENPAQTSRKHKPGVHAVRVYVRVYSITTILLCLLFQLLISHVVVPAHGKKSHPCETRVRGAVLGWLYNYCCAPATRYLTAYRQHRDTRI